MSSHASQDSRAETARNAKRRKRTDRSAKNTAPEPKDIVSGAGQPLDLSVRRELEERLGHDFSRVRLHTDRDAGALTDLLGADAIAVGQDIFFREGTYRPGTADGQRLLAHELLHTVQNPDGLGALRAGRDLGAVSLPEQAVEREAESAAQESVRNAMLGSVREDEPAAGVEAGQPTPGWLRYATVDADRRRAELLDPATLVDRLANSIVRSLRGDPEDLSGRVRMQLSRMAPDLQESVLDRLEVRLLSPEFNGLLKLIGETEEHPPELGPALAPEPVPDTVEQLQDTWAAQERAAASEHRSDDRKAEDAREERRATGSEGGKQDRERERDRESQDAAAEKKEAAERTAQEDERAKEQEQTEQEQQQAEEKQAQERQEADQADREKAEDREQDTEQAKKERKAQREREEQDPEQANAPGGEKRKRKDDAKKRVAGSKQEEVDPKAKGQPGPVRPEKVDERAEQRDSALSEHGLHEKDEDEGDPREEEQPLGLEAGADREIGGEQGEAGKGGAGAGEPELKPEDYLPETDLDLSAVPTADNPDAPVPTFPAPPPTRAERIQEQRENDAEEEEDEDAPESELKPPGAEIGPVEGEAPQPADSPAAEAGDRTEKDLQPEKPVDQEVGPDPETEERQDPEPEAEKPDPEQQQDQESARTAAERQDEDEKDTEADGQEEPDAKDAGEQQQERKEQDEREEKQEAAKGQPEGAAAGKPTSAPSGSDSASSRSPEPTAAPPAGAHTEKTAAEDRNPSPAARRVADSTKAENEASGPKSQIPKETGPGAAPSGNVGGSEPSGPSPAAGPGGAPSVAHASVSPAGEQAEAPGRMGAPAPEGAKAKPEASLEKDGGGCAPPEPAPEKEEGKGGCGGGGGAAAKEEKQQEPPDVSAQDPKAALSTVSSLPPDQAQKALPGVDAAGEKKANDERKRLAANPPKRERPSGAPRTQSAPPKAAAPATPETGKLEKVGPEDEGEKQKAKGGEKAKGKKPTEGVPPPQINPGKDGKISAGDAGSIEAAADQVPTTDPELRNKTVGPAPKIKLTGKSDPKRTDKQAEKLKEKQGKIHGTGREDAAKPMGEDQIFPNAPKEELRGDVRGGGKGRGGGGQPTGPEAKSHVGVVAKQERGGEIRGASGEAQGQLAAKEKEHQQGEQQEKRQKQAEMDREVQQNAEKQTAERGRAAEQANAERTKWRDEQDKKIEDADKKSEKEHGEQNKKITKGRDDKDKEVSDRKDTDNKDIDTKADKAEKDAEKKKEEKKNESDSLFGKLIDAIGDFFSALLDAVTAIFDAAREAINSVIDKFKEFANAAIDFVRDLAIAAINVLADALIAVCDVLLAAFPELRDKFRRAIEGLRDAAIAAVNTLADGLKKAVNALLDALAAGLNALLDVLEAGIKFAIKLYRDAIIGALKFAEAAIEALGKFAALVADIAPDVGGWLSKAGSSAKAGITDHLWGAIKTGVKQWFDTKVEGILGLGKAVINVLVKGCVSIKQIGKMAWDAIIASLPMMIASIVIEKVVSMLVPAAGAILTVVQGLMAAWQSLSSILTAFSKFWAYLKAVKAGPAACLFAEAVAAGIVALLDFIANFLMIRLSGATKGVGKRLKTMAQKIMKGLKKTGKGAKKAAGNAVNKARGAARKAQEALNKPAKPAKPKGPRVPKNRSETTDRGPGGNRSQGKDAVNDRPNSQTPKQDKEQQRKDTDESAGPTPTGPKDRTPDQKPDGRSDKSPDSNSSETKDSDGKKDKAPETPKKRRETDAPKRTKPRKPTSPLGKALKKVKGKVKSALKKIRNAAKALGKKLRKSKLGKALKKTGTKLRDFFKKMRNKLRNRKRDRTDDRRNRQRDRDKNEKSKDAKSARLRRAVNRIRPLLKKVIGPGVSQPVHRAVLAGLRKAYRLTSLEKRGGREEFSVWATLNPAMKTVGGFTDAKDRHDYLEQHGYPEAKIPKRRDDSLSNPKANIPTKHANGEFISKATPRGEKPPAANYGQPKGWQHVLGSGMTDDTAWVRMHLLPEALGGLAGGNNLVPARSQRTNLKFYDEIEENAHSAVTKNDALIWYDAVAKFGHADFPGFPSYIRASYGEYEKKKPSLTGRSRSHWHRSRKGEDDTYAQFDIPKPDATEETKLHINSAGEDTLRNRLGAPLITYRVARAIAGVLPGGGRQKTKKNGKMVPVARPVYHNPDDVKEHLDGLMKKGYGLTPEKIDDVIARLRKMAKEINWGVTKDSRGK
ncbi:eCIS core domain-containing protein [Streptomyces xinghaiensis]|uniref:eCIS core domain-containing protein n=1 Tax=Streptomyces xinghaiensis TaxID=1038928 RepID=UPI0034147B63